MIRLRDSKLWKLQSDFYDQLGDKAWSDAIVPSFITSNSYIASCYAQLILSFLLSVFNNDLDDVKEPLFIIEIGAGHGKLAYLILSKLVAMMPPSRNGQDGSCVRPFKYILSDFTPRNVDYMQHHPHLQRFVEGGWLDFALANAEEETSFTLIKSGFVLSRGATSLPLIAITNYIFDTLRQDAFQVIEGRLHEVRCEVKNSSSYDEPGPHLCNDAAIPSSSVNGESDRGKQPDHVGTIINQLEFDWSSIPCDLRYYEGNELMNQVLQHYVNTFEDASFVVPIGGLRAFDTLVSIANGRLLLLAGDKAITDDSEIKGLHEPHIALHGSFSFMANFHFLKEYTRVLGGFSLLTKYVEGFKCGAFLTGFSDRDCSLNQFKLVWASTMDSFGPDNFANLQRCIKDEVGEASLRTVLTLLRLSSFDCDVFLKFKQTIIDKLPYANDKTRFDIHNDVLRVYANYYPLHIGKDVSFEVARILMGLKKYRDAIPIFESSITHCGDHHVTYYNIGICRYHLSLYEDSLSSFRKALTLREDYTDALTWIKKVLDSISSCDVSVGTVTATDDTSLGPVIDILAEEITVTVDGV